MLQMWELYSCLWEWNYRQKDPVSLACQSIFLSVVDQRVGASVQTSRIRQVGVGEGDSSDNLVPDG